MYLISLPGSWHRAPQAFEISWVIIASFLSYEKSLLSTQEFMLMRWLRLESLSSIKMRLVTWKTKRLRDWKGVGLEIQLYKIQLLNINLMNFHIANISKCWEGDTTQFHEWQNLLCWGPFWTSPSVHLHLIIIFIIIYFIHIVACEISYIMLHFISLYGNINVFQSFVSSLTNCYG